MQNLERHKTIAVIPALNEEGRIGVTVKKTIDFVDEVVVVNDGSSDSTVEEAKQAGANVLSHKKNKGVGAAIRTGIDYAIKKDYHICVVLGGDDQDKPSQIPDLIKTINEGYDFVQGSRYLRRGDIINIPLFRRVTTKFYSLFFGILAGFPITDGTNGFRAFRLNLFKNKKINIWQEWLNRYELEPYLYFKCILEKLKVKETPVTKKYPYGEEDYTKMIPLLDWWRITRPLIYLKFKIKK